MSRTVHFWKFDLAGEPIDLVELGILTLHRLTRSDRCIIVHSQHDWLRRDVPIQWLDDLISSLRRKNTHTFLLVTPNPLLWQERITLLANFGGRSSDFARLWLDGHVPHNLILTQPDPAQPSLDRVIQSIPSAQAPSTRAS